MSQPTDTNYPTSYDDDDSLLGALRNREVYTVAGMIDVDDLWFHVEEELDNVNLPTYVAFAGGEIAYIEEVGGTPTKIFICSSLDDRGVLGSTIQPHGVGEDLILGALSPHHVLFKLAIMAGQKYQGLIGLDVDKPEFPDPGHRYTAIDTGKTYYCFVADNWVDVICWLHSHTTGRDDDDHAQYHTDGRADTWHGNEPGGHIVDGDDHLHKTGAAVLRFHGGLNAGKPANPSEEAEVYYSTDLDGGTLFIGFTVDETLVWTKISGIPTGGIVGFAGACPAGWTRYDNLNERIPMGAVTAGATGGATTHVHGISEMRQHYHGIASSQHNVTAAGEHCHSIGFGSGAGGAGSIKFAPVGAGNNWSSTSSDGSHYHDVNIPQANTSNAGQADAETAAGDNVPTSRQIVWCSKD